MLEGQLKARLTPELLRIFSCTNTRREFLHGSKMGEMTKAVDVVYLEFRKTSFPTAFSWLSRVKIWLCAGAFGEGRLLGRKLSQI